MHNARSVVFLTTVLMGYGISTSAQATTAQQATAPAAADAVEAGSAPSATSTDLGEIVVTGTRQTNLTAQQSLSPIQVLSSDTLAHTGKPGLEEILSDVLPSFTLPAQAGGNMSSIIREATLRGLNPDQVLVLVNGKRWHPSSIVNVAGSIGVGAQPVDLNMIPTASIERIEVLSDGAAALYGSDAIAGVINIILKSSDHGGDVDVQTGKYYAGDGPSTNFNADAGFKLGSDGFFVPSVSILQQNITNRAVDATLTPRYYAGDPRNNLPDGILYQGYGIPDVHTDQFGFNSAKPLTSAVTFYSFGSYTRSVGENWVGYRAANNANDVTAIFPDGFEPRLITKQDDMSLTLGVKGEDLIGWNWDLSSTYGRNADNIELDNSVNPTYGLESPTDFREGMLIATEVTNNLDFRRGFDTGIFAAPLSTAFGFEQRLDGYGIRAGQVQSYGNGGQPQLTGPSAGQFVDVPGAQALAGFRPADAGDHWRNNVGTYLDLETTLAPKWDIGLAGRYEHYSDFGDNVSGKFSTRYQLAEPVALRATISNGFHAPSMGQEYYSASATSQYKGVDYNTVNVPVNSEAAKILDAQPLKAEKSTNYSAGIVLTPLRSMTVTIDTYRIDIRDRIVESANIGLTPSGALDPGVATVLEAQGIYGVNAARYFLNGVNTRTQGADVIGAYRTDFAEYGVVSWSAAYNVGNTKITGVSALANETIYGTQVFNQVSRDYITKTNPNSKLILGADYSIRRWRVLVHETRYGAFDAPSTVTGAYSYETPKWLTDLELSYGITSAWQVAIGAQNAFNVYPDKTNPKNFAAATFNGAQIYNPYSPFGISGGNYYARVSYSW
jgi:iron complex outermembrane receptor protein